MYTITLRDEEVYRGFMDRVAQEGISVDQPLRKLLDREPQAIDMQVAGMYTLTLQDEAVYRKLMDRVAREGSSINDVLSKLLDTEQ